jgi:plasmid stability protein
MKNVTLTLDEETARWARVEAARRDISVSRLLREILEAAKSSYESYPAAMGRYQARPAVQLKAKGGYPSREELHARADLR